MRAQLITPPTAEPVALDTVKAHLRETGSAQDDLIAMYLTAAREHVEATTGARCVEQEWRLTLDAFPCGRIKLPGYPLRSVTSVAYVDPDGAAQAVDVGDLIVNTAARPGWIELPDGWPSTKAQSSVVTIDYSVGFAATAAPTEVPSALVSAILLLVGDLFENRQGQQRDSLQENRAVNSLLWPFRLLSP